SKLTEDMYRALQQEFQSDKAAKLKSDLVDLPKGGVAEAKKKKDEEEVLFKKDDKKSAKKPAAEEPKEEVAVPEPIKAELAPVTEEKEITKVDAPEIEGPKVLDKIDLSAIDSSTRPKKGAKKKTEKEEPAEEIKPAAKKKSKKEEVVEEEPVAEIQETKELITTEGEEELPPVIENIKAEKIEGPKILGKIDLPVDSDTRPKKEEKRKRKRIPIEKKEVKREDLFKDRRDGNNRPPGQFNRGGPSRPGDRRGPGGGSGGGRRDIRRREDKEIDQKEIQEKIRETQ